MNVAGQAFGSGGGLVAGEVFIFLGLFECAPGGGVFAEMVRGGRTARVRCPSTPIERGCGKMLTVSRLQTAPGASRRVGVWPRRR